MERVKDIMTTNPVTVTPQVTIDHVAQLMKSKDVGPIPIVQDQASKKLEGIVTDRDIVLKVVAENQDPKTTRVEDVMTSNPVTLKPEDDVEAARRTMAEHQIRRVLVVDDAEKLVGIVAQKDLATRTDNVKKTGEMVKEISEG